MTAIDFYTHVNDRLEVATKLVAKAFAQHGSVRVLTADAAASAARIESGMLTAATSVELVSGSASTNQPSSTGSNVRWIAARRLTPAVNASRWRSAPAGSA